MKIIMKEPGAPCDSIHVRLLGMLLLTAGMLSSPFAALAAYQGEAVVNGGTISGVVMFKGTPPTLKPIVVHEGFRLSKDFRRVCDKAPIFSQALLVGKNKGIRNVVVRLTDITIGKPLESASVTLAEKDCEFRPHVVIVQTGGEVIAPNDDPLTHNIHTFAFDNPQLNHAQPAGAPVLMMKPTVPETIRVQCDIHHWMTGWIIVAEHPYYAVTDERGQFTLTDVPPGTYTLEFWQETLGVVTQRVTVKANQPVRVSARMLR